MKLHRKLFATGVVATSLLTFTACNDFLDLEPPSNVTPESYFQNDEQLGAYAIGRYNDVFTTPSGWGQGSIINGDAGTDNMAATDPKIIPKVMAKTSARIPNSAETGKDSAAAIQAAGTGISAVLTAAGISEDGARVRRAATCTQRSRSP